MDIKIGSRDYRLTKLDPFKQFQLLRRMGSLLPAIMGAVKVPDKIMGAGFISNAISQLSDENSDFVINTCLRACQLKQGTVWADVMNANNSLMFKELELPDILEIVWRVLEFNFRPFIPDLLARVSGGAVQE